MHGEAPTSYLTGVPGWESPSEQALLVKLAQDVPSDGVIVEIGAEFGMSSSLFAYGAPATVDIYSIDLFPGDLMAKHLANLAEAGFASRVEAQAKQDGGPGYMCRTNVIKGDSVEIAQTWPHYVAGYGRNGDWIDLLFVDGDHTYKGVARDLSFWAGKVKPGGRIVFHDVAQHTNHSPHPQHFEVAAAIRDWLGDQPVGLWAEVNQIDSMLVIQRQ
jgi:predicted O-methyltransferase YrrM